MPDLDAASGGAGASRGSILSIFWKVGRSDIVQSVREKWEAYGQVPCLSELGLVAMESEWRKD